MNRVISLLDPMFVGERDDLTFPCARALKDGESIAGVVITSARDHGAADADAASLVSTPPLVSGSNVIQRVIGVKAGVWYRIEGTITLSSGRILVGVGLLYGQGRSES